MNEKRTRKRKAADMRPRVLLDGYEAFVTGENLPAIFLCLIIKAEGDASLVAAPDANHIVSLEVIYSPEHLSYFKEHSREKPLLSGLCEFNCVLRYKR